MQIKISIIAAAVFLMTVYAFSQEKSSLPLNVVPSIEFNRYIGTWYEVARLPNRFQNDCAGDVTATYSLLENGRISVVNRCLKTNGDTARAEGEARIADADGPNTKLKVRFAPRILSFLPFVWGNYWIIDLARDYSYAVVGEPDRKYLWILSRKPEMAEDTLRTILGQVTGQGYDISTLIRTRQGIKQ